MIKKVKLREDESKRRSSLKKEKPYVYEKIMKYPEKLEKGESTAIIQFQYNYACNFKCQHCSIDGFQKEKSQRFFTLDDVKNLSKQADEMGLAQFTITGGEPLIFKDFDELVAAIDPSKFYIATDTNGWLLDEKRAKHLKSIGVDKVHISLDSFDAEEHDAFRRTKGSHARALKAIDAAKEAGLNILINTIVTNQRIHSEEFINYLELMKEKDVPTLALYPKLVGLWEGRYDILPDKEGVEFVKKLGEKYKVFTHLSNFNGINFGCPAVKRMISIIRTGDVMPCPWIYTSLGNVFEEPLKDILDRGMNIKYFGNRMETCLSSENLPFIKKYVEGRMYGKKMPVPYTEVFTQEDMIKYTKKPQKE
ncbi:MAG: radical SAM protein [Candidatus Gastranaerophilaceae bacterium]